MCQNSTDSQKPLSGICAKVQGQATAQLQLSHQSPTMCQCGVSLIAASVQSGPVYNQDSPPGATLCSLLRARRAEEAAYSAMPDRERFGGRRFAFPPSTAVPHRKFGVRHLI